MPCLFKHVSYIIYIFKHGGVFAHAGDCFCNVKFLVADCSEREAVGELLGVACRCGVFDLAADNKHRNGIKPASDNAGNCICAAGTCCNTERCDFIVKPCIRFCCDCTCLLVMVICAMNSFIMAESVIEVHCTAADNRKAVGYSVVGKKICNIVSKSYLHLFHPLSVLI